jgi:D-alanine-D-alanine ligase
MKILIVYNVATSLKKGVPQDLDCEHEIIIIVPLIKGILESAGHLVSTLECGIYLWERLKEFQNKIDIVFNLAESFGGTNADEPLVAAMLEALDFLFTGASATNMYLTLDKEKSKLVAKAYGIPVAPHIVTKQADMARLDFVFPVIVKPIREEASVGIYLNNVISNIDDLRSKIAHVIATYKQPALIEPFIRGRELSVGIIGNDSDLLVLPSLEFLFPQARAPEEAFRSYEYKWGGNKEVMVRANLPMQIETLLADYSRVAFQAMECRDYARMDYRLTATNEIYLLEVNHNPGIGPNTHGLNNTLTMMAEFVNMTFEQLILRLIEVAWRRR